jgi:aryl-alcohol dehydrogenase-like predicted oxidoreductase
MIKDAVEAQMERRDFLKTSAVGAVGVAAASLPPTVPAEAANAAAAALEPTEQGGMKYRTLGRTGERVSLVGIGGFHLAKPGPQQPSEAEAIRIVRTGLDAGINFCDNCWDYNGGESEIRMGKALRDGYRDRAFLMTKIDGHTAEAAMGQLETSLRRLQTDHLDLLQFHEIIRMDDPDRIFAPGGALEAVLRAREQGKLRYIGFTGHKSPAIHQHMFAVADRQKFHFDTVQMPVNVMDAHFDSFIHGVMPVALEHGTAVLAMKTFGDPFIFQSAVASPIDLLHYSMSQPVSVVVCGCDQFAYLQQALDAVHSFRPMTEAEQAALLAESAAAAADGQTEPYKVSTHFDGTVQNPQWLVQA